jgi:uncharacterized membrane protein HdeD (DUF308 family)
LTAGLRRGAACRSTVVVRPLHPSTRKRPQSRGTGEQVRWGIFVGIVNIIAGIVVLAWPFDSIVILALVVGIWLTVIGIVETMSAFQMRKSVNTIQGEWHRGRAGRA